MHETENFNFHLNFPELLAWGAKINQLEEQMSELTDAIQSALDRVNANDAATAQALADAAALHDSDVAQHNTDADANAALQTEVDALKADIAAGIGAANAIEPAPVDAPPAPIA